MATFVLVHGAWSGANGFRHVRRLLQAAGHEVFTPSLTGIGERSHLTSPLIGLNTHVRDVSNHVLYEDHRDFVLLGFSYGGFVVTGSIEHIGDRIRHLVFLDAFVPSNGESMLAHLGRADRAPAQLNETWLVPSPERAFDDAEEARWIGERRGPHPMRCFTEQVYLSKPLENFNFTRTYIKATVDREANAGAEALWRAARHAEESPAWNYRQIATTHMVASNRPEELASMLLSLTSTSSPDVP